jgi:hypothetical protein
MPGTIGVVMQDYTTIDLPDDRSEKDEIDGPHAYLEKLRKPDELNDLVMANLDLVLEKLGAQCDPAEVWDQIVALNELIQIRHLRDELKRKRLAVI